jgi:hypothetical protein
MLNGDYSIEFQEELSDEVRCSQQHRRTADRLRACALQSMGTAVLSNMKSIFGS